MEVIFWSNWSNKTLNCLKFLWKTLISSFKSHRSHLQKSASILWDNTATTRIFEELICWKRRINFSVKLHCFGTMPYYTGTLEDFTQIYTNRSSMPQLKHVLFISFPCLWNMLLQSKNQMKTTVYWSQALVYEHKWPGSWQPHVMSWLALGLCNL